MRRLYQSLAILGAVLPYSQFIPWLAAHGLNLRLLYTELFAGRASAFFALDVIVSALVLLLFIVREGIERKMRTLWLPVAATCLIGVSCGLPLFLALRERPGGRHVNNRRSGQ
jgi:Terpene cyclase DEP1